MTLSTQQLENLNEVNASITEDEFDNDSFLDALESLLEDGIDVSVALFERFGTTL